MASGARTIACVGRNYAAHAAELKNAVPKKPFFFLKPVSSLVLPGHRQVIEIPKDVGEVHYEAELAVIMSKKARNVQKEDAYSFIKGYTVAIDVTGRTLQDEAKKNGLPWTVAKGHNTWCPVGTLVDRNKIEDPHDLTVCLSVNGEEKQRASTGLMLFRIPELVESVTNVMTLCDGDMLLTGTPAGVGRIEHGDVVKCWIEGLPCPPLELDVIDLAKAASQATDEDCCSLEV